MRDEDKIRIAFKEQQLDVWQHILDKGQDPIEWKVNFILNKRNEWAEYAMNHDRITDPSNITPVAYPLVMDWVKRNLEQFTCEPVPELNKIKRVRAKTFYLLLLMEVKHIEGFRESANGKATIIKKLYLDNSLRLISDYVKEFKIFDSIDKSINADPYKFEPLTRELLNHFLYLAQNYNRRKLVEKLKQILE